MAEMVITTAGAEAGARQMLEQLLPHAAEMAEMELHHL
jgi:hypothetical protein